MVWGANSGMVDAKFRMPLILLALLYLLHTTGELFLSPVGLSEITKLSVPAMVSFMMAVWFLASSIAHFVGGMIAGAAGTETVGGQVLDPAGGAQHLAGRLQHARLGGRRHRRGLHPGQLLHREMVERRERAGQPSGTVADGRGSRGRQRRSPGRHHDGLIRLTSGKREGRRPRGRRPFQFHGTQVQSVLRIWRKTQGLILVPRSSRNDRGEALRGPE